MLFSSIVFLFTFLPVILILYYLVPRRLKNAVLLLCSLVFYAWGEPVYIFLMIFSIIFNYISGLDIARNLKNRRAARGSLIFNLIVNLGILGFFKYEGFLLDSLNRVLPVDIPYRELALPIGISFYTFQILSYIIDVYRQNVKAQKNFMDFALYVTMFPQLIAGPIVRYSDIEKQLHSRQESFRKFGDGAMFFIRGLAKKVLLANTIGMVFTEVTSLDPGKMSVLSAWLGCAAYTFQIYFDFSGYSDMAIGLGKMFGFEFLKNFDYPYISRSITEFWRRWHISLSTFFRDYVYIPLGGNRKGPVRTIINLFVVWFLTGMWHGASWNYILWGLYFFVFLVIEKNWLLKKFQHIPHFVSHIYALVVIYFGWVLFKFEDLAGVGITLKGMLGLNGNGFTNM